MGKTTTSVIVGQGIMSKQKKVSQSRSHRAGLTMPVSKLNRHLREKKQEKHRVGAGAPVYLAAVLEYAAAEIWEAACTNLGPRKRVMVHDVMDAIRSDTEMNQLFSGCAAFAGDRVKDVRKAITLPEDEAKKKAKK